MKNERFHVPGALMVVAFYDRWNGLSYVAWKPNVSMHFKERKDLLRFCSWPIKTPTGDALRAWLNEVEQEAAPKEQPQETALTSEALATGFGPECHLDEADPNYQTRTVI